MDEREAFHDWACEEAIMLKRSDVEGRDYFYELAETAWRAWNARAVLSKRADEVKP